MCLQYNIDIDGKYKQIKLGYAIAIGGLYDEIDPLKIVVWCKNNYDHYRH